MTHGIEQYRRLPRTENVKAFSAMKCAKLFGNNYIANVSKAVLFSIFTVSEFENAAGLMSVEDSFKIGPVLQC